MKIVEFRNVYKDYHLGEIIVHALRGVDLTIDQGDFTAICGPSGSGKTTILNMAGVIDSPTLGDVILNGEYVARQKENTKAELRSSMIGYIFQTFNLIPVLSALENVMLPLQIRKNTGLNVKDEAVKRLEEVGLGTHLHHRPDKLSGGQRQRVAIARALITNPYLIIADEPTANLDHKTALSILDLMKDLNKKQNVTFLFSTHDQSLISKMDKIIRIEDGRLISNE
ncbi:MAG: ABC transporter ATP-binding protein [Candidatus Brocadiaceae bacterium]|nr:ABC transporter ATP-binding protein [Candidatus Brocadiaceae bacterium]